MEANAAMQIKKEEEAIRISLLKLYNKQPSF
jgi:hypothetical protein